MPQQFRLRKVNEDADNIIHSNVLSIFTRLSFLLKLCLVLTSAIRCLKKFVNEITFVHAHTIFSDGICAYLFSIIFDKKLILTVRGTDVNLGFKFFWHYKWLAKLALRKACKVIFISPTHRVLFKSYFGDEFDDKLITIPNGVDEYFLKKVLNQSERVDDGVVKGVYVGAAFRNKNIKNAIIAFFRANKQSDALFYIIGCTYRDYVNVYGEIDPKIKARVSFLGHLSKECILDYLRMSNLFVMVSKSETFGLVYIEAISQCLPIIYSQGQGVDGYFNDGDYGFRSDPNDIESITHAITKTLSFFPLGLGPFDVNPAEGFSWSSIASKYNSDIYK
ncbi:glycosyltransferase family 4 protein [Pseudoalteromonas sp. ASV78]|uniref:glycosyltransferase family 4 protein n=1 Tax=Pseudoalteromonas sp. ASV78 TaxID=3397851 RepID=UPI0039FCD233